MKYPPLRTVLVGLGKVGLGYAADARMARYYPYATHAQVLSAHPAFAWEAVIERDAALLPLAQQHWHIPYAVTEAAALHPQYAPQVAVLATPPAGRLALLAQLPSVRAVLVEKPLGNSVREAREFLDYCHSRGILVQVNLWRRADRTLRRLASGWLHSLLGPAQALFGVYGNGLRNNGTHMVDLIRMLYGDVAEARALAAGQVAGSGPLPDDLQVPFVLYLHSGLSVAMQPIHFAHYRENSLEIWGQRARLCLLQEGLQLLLYPRESHRAMQDEYEIAVDQPQALPSTVGDAFYQMYDNLAEAVHTGAPLWSPGASALQTAQVIETIYRSAQCYPRNERVA
ncbi:MAG: Gfo/Idh/MocA family oxidoreductase [Candidatus Tectimicrobiota bacterium]